METISGHLYSYVSAVMIIHKHKSFKAITTMSGYLSYNKAAVDFVLVFECLVSAKLSTTVVV